MHFSKLLVRLANLIKGPHRVVFDESDGHLKHTFLHIKGVLFEMHIYYEVNVYHIQYTRWFIPNSCAKVICLSVSFTGQPPERLAKACLKSMCLPYKGAGTAPSGYVLYNASNLYLEVLRQRGLPV